MRTVGIVQARMGSSRLPGKMMHPLDGIPVIDHVLGRVEVVDAIDRVILATTERHHDDVLVRRAERAGVCVSRGDETDVLGRMYGAATNANADRIVRVSGDSPLVSPTVIGAGLDRLRQTGADYVSDAVGERTLLTGLGAEVFSMNSFARIHREADQPHHREHVTVYYREHPDRYDVRALSASEVFDSQLLHRRSDIRLTLDEPLDYEVLAAIYENVDFEDILDVRDAIAYVDEQGLSVVNADVRQKKATRSDGPH